MKKVLVIIGLVFLLAACNQNSELEQGFTPSGFALLDEPNSVVSNGSSIYVAGNSFSFTDGKPSFIRKYTWSIYDGSAIWTKYFGKFVTPDMERLTDITIDSSGNVFVGSIQRTSDDIKTSYVYKFDSAWNMLWKRKTYQTSDAYYSYYYTNSSLSTDLSGNIYVSILDKIVKYSPSGQLLLTIRHNRMDSTEILATPTGRIYLRIGTEVYFYNAQGKLLGFNTVCNSSIDLEIALGLNGSVYALCNDLSNAVQVIDASGGVSGGLGFSFDENSRTVIKAIATDKNGDVYLVGWSHDKEIFGHANKGGSDAFIMKHSFSNGGGWVRFLGGNGIDEIYDIAVGDSVYVVGKSFSNPNLNKQSFESPGFAARLRKTDGHVLGIDQ